MSEPPETGDAPPHLATVTGTALLHGLESADNQTLWQQYVDRYRPLIVGFAERAGLSHADAEDVAQVGLVDFSRAYLAGSYDRGRGRLRDWLFGIVQNRIRNHRRQRDLGVLEADGASEVLESAEAPDDLEEMWEEEWRRAVLRECMREARREFQETTYRAFELFALEGWSAERVGQELEISPNAVYGAKRRVMRRIRQIEPFMDEIW